MLRSLRSRRGFTLVELLVIVLILGILVAVALPSYTNSTTTARQNAADGNARAIAAALKSSGTKAGGYPSTGLADANVLADLGGNVPDNPCSASTGAGGYTYTYTSATSVSIQANNDKCTGFTGKTYALSL